MRTHASGFSLIEILIVVALVGVLAAVTAPTVAAGMKRYSLISASQQVASTIRSARFQTVGKNRILEVQFDADTGQYRVFEDDGITQVGAVQYLPDGVSFGADATVEFDTDGRLKLGSAAATIVVTNGNEEQDRTITVSTSGRVQLQ